METTDKTSCRILIELLKTHNISDVVISPGSRNTPLIIAAAREKKLSKTVILDERSAAFVALGICLANNGEKPVALICTSGSALLNYAPAIAEAYYRNLPIIVISADRPIEWIDQDDSQTIRQYEALSNYVKKSYNIPSLCESNNLKWYVNRVVNDAIMTANYGRKAPVHINIQIDEPLNQMIRVEQSSPRFINMPIINRALRESFIESELYSKIRNKRILIIAGFQNCENRNWVINSKNPNANDFEKFIERHTNVVLFSESISNINLPLSIQNIDRVLSSLDDAEKTALRPEIVITFGGALVSRLIKQYLRELNPDEHWHIGLTDTTIDCFQSITMRVEMQPNEFFSQICSINDAKNVDNSYREQWLNIAKRAEISHNQFVCNCQWCDLKAYSILLPQLSGNLHLSNGTPIRYQQLFNYNNNIISVNCNRGVSGIDGCTSTAIGHAIASGESTILVTGDLSAQYDIGALSINNIPNTFKIIVFCNGGGSIFRFIKSTSNLPELEDYFVTKSNLPLKELATAYNFNYFKASSEDELIDVMPDFLNNCDKPSILAIYTPAVENAEILKKYFNR